jgi:hypothetical protein
LIGAISIIDLLNGLRIDCVVLPMRSDEADIDHAVWIVDPDHDTIFVAGDIEDNTATLRMLAVRTSLLTSAGLAQSARFTNLGP